MAHANPVAPPNPQIRIETVDPQRHKADLVSLFTEHGVPHYPEFMEAAYPAATVGGSRHWVGLDAQDRVVMHMGRFTHRFGLGSRVVRGGLLVNMMVHRDHRTFFPIAAMMRRVVADSKQEGAVDFLYTNPNEGGAAIIKAGGLKPRATLRRLALVIGASGPADVAVRVYSGVRRMLANSPRLEMAVHDARGFDTDVFAAPGRSDRVAPYHPRPWYTIWLPGYPSAEDRWFTFTDGGRIVGAVQVREYDRKVYRLLTVWRGPDVSLGSLVWPISSALRGEGGRRLLIWTIEESRFGAELKALGFLGREDAQPMFTLPFTPAGEEIVTALPKWEITDFDCDR